MLKSGKRRWGNRRVVVQMSKAQPNCATSLPFTGGLCHALDVCTVKNQGRPESRYGFLL